MEVVIDNADGEGFREVVEARICRGEGVADVGGDVALDEQVVRGLNGDGLRNPPVGLIEGESGGTGDAINGDLIAAGDGESDGGSGCSAEDGAVEDGGSGVFC